MLKKTITKLLAFVCSVCPLCIFTRAYPHLKISKALLKIESACPFCAAYNTRIREKHEKG